MALFKYWNMRINKCPGKENVLYFDMTIHNLQEKSEICRFLIPILVLLLNNEAGFGLLEIDRKGIKYTG